MVYLAVNDEVVSSILIKEGTEDQLLIYFISKPLQGAEVRYQKLEKVVCQNYIIYF